MGGIGFLGALTIVFVVLKLMDVIAWSWWIVFSPVLLGAGLTILFYAGLFVLAYMASRD